MSEELVGHDVRPEGNAELLRRAALCDPGFKSPKRVVFTDTLPKNPSGKILKRELRTTVGGG